MKAIKMQVLHVTLAKIQKFSSYSVIEFVKNRYSSILLVEMPTEQNPIISII